MKKHKSPAAKKETNHVSIVHKKRRNISKRQLFTIGVLFVFAFVGAWLLRTSMAATTSVAAEAEHTTVVGPAAVKTVANASGGSALQFGPPVQTGTPVSGGCSSGNVPTPCIGNTTTGDTTWGNTVFSDEFDGTTLDTNKWGPCIGYPNCGRMNGVTTSTSNVAVTGGSLVLTMNNGNGALVHTDPNQGAKTGFVFTTRDYAEARIYFPGNGSEIYNWPAWWTSSYNWPMTGEIDIAEGLVQLTANYHWGPAKGQDQAQHSGAIPGTWSNAYHIYGVDRQANKYDVYWDGKLIKSYTSSDNSAPQFLLLNVGIDTNIVPSTTTSGAASAMKVDYVRVWHK